MKRIQQIFKALATQAAVILVGLTQFAYAMPSPVLRENALGSFLVFSKFDIRDGTSTQFRIVNNDSYFARVKINYVCPGVKHGDDRCRALDRTFDFTPHQTRIVDVADQNPPCNQGYAVAFVTATASEPGELSTNSIGAAISYNQMTGSYQIVSGRRVEAVNAMAIQSFQSAGKTLGSGSPIQFAFGFGDYASLPSNLYTDFRSVTSGSLESPAEGSRLTLLTLDVLAGAQNPAAYANIDFWSASEEPFSTSIEFICWTEVQLQDIDANFIEDNLGTSHGSMKITSVGNCPIAGLCPPTPLYDATLLGSIVEYGDGEVGGRLLAHDLFPKITSYRPR